MKNTSQLAILSALLFLSSAFAEPGTQQVASQSKGDRLPIDYKDAKIAMDRIGAYKRFRPLFSADPYSFEVKDSVSEAKLKTLMAKREFSTWFRFHNEVARNLNENSALLDSMVKPVLGAQEGFLAKLMMIRQAKYTIDLTYYIFDTDEAGYSLVDELVKAVRRGVNVRILVDSLGSLGGTLSGNQHFHALLAVGEKEAGFVTDPATGQKTKLKAKVEVVTFNPVSNVSAALRSAYLQSRNFLAKKFPRLGMNQLTVTHWNPNRRNHEKILLTDGEFPELSVAILGGRNISNHYYELDPNDHENFRDLEVIVRNNPTAARQMPRNDSIGHVLSVQYDRLFFHRANRNLNNYFIGALQDTEENLGELKAATSHVEKVTQATLEKFGEDINSPEFGKKYLQTGFVSESVRFVNSTNNLLRTLSNLQDAIRLSSKVESFDEVVKTANDDTWGQDLLREVVLLMAEEKEAITIVSPYLWLSDRDVGFIKSWLKVDPKRTFTVYTNSIVTSDNMPAQILVDVATAPKLMADSSFHDQIRFYEYGRQDDVNLGGKKYYGKLHFKGAYLQSSKASLVTTYNKDPRSQMLNSESGFIIYGPEYAASMEKEIADLHANSHVWGSEEFRNIRSNPKLPDMKQKIIQKQQFLYDLIVDLKLWWLI